MVSAKHAWATGPWSSNNWFIMWRVVDQAWGARSWRSSTIESLSPWHFWATDGNWVWTFRITWTVVSEIFKLIVSTSDKAFYWIWIRSCEEKLDRITVHFRLLSVAQNVACISNYNFWTFYYFFKDFCSGFKYFWHIKCDAKLVNFWLFRLAITIYKMSKNGLVKCLNSFPFS